jgi:hypothetical protein
MQILQIDIFVADLPDSNLSLPQMPTGKPRFRCHSFRLPAPPSRSGTSYPFSRGRAAPEQARKIGRIREKPCNCL